MDALLEILDLHQFRGQRHVLKGLNLTINRGEIIGLIGRNGSGKTTLAKVIAGEMRPRSGRMRLDDENYQPRSRAEAQSAGISVIEQGETVEDDATIIRAMYRNTFMADWSDDDLLERGQEILDRTEFELSLTDRVSGLDPAEKSLVEVLRVLAEEAPLVIFDEVSALLNDLEIGQLHHAMRRLRDQGCAIIHVAHRLEEVSALCDRIIVLRNGVVAWETPQGTHPDDLVRAMLDRELRETTPLQRQPGQELLSVQGFTVPGAVEDVDFSVHAGEVVGVIGLRGSGAGEFVEALGGERDADARHQQILGHEISSIGDHRDRVNYHPAPTDDLNGRKISEVLTAELDDTDTNEFNRLRRAISEVQHLELSTSDIQGNVSDLSGGDRQKILISNATKEAGDVVVFAYPTRGVDIGAKAMTYDLIHEMVAEDRAVIILSVDVSELMSACDRVVIVHDHRIVANLPVSDVDEDLIMTYAMTGAAPETRQSRGSRGNRGESKPEELAAADA